MTTNITMTGYHNANCVCHPCDVAVCFSESLMKPVESLRGVQCCQLNVLNKALALT